MFAGLLSLFINTLYLTFPLYMLGVYVRVLVSYSMPTLTAFTVLALFALLVLGILDFIRSRILVKAGVKMDELLSRRVLKTMLADLARVGTEGYTKGLQDVNTLRNYLAGNNIFAFFDVPWIFIYLAVIFLIHPVLGMTATAGGFILLGVGVVQTLITRRDSAVIDDVKNQQRAFLLKSFRSSQLLRTMGMLSSTADHLDRINDQAEPHRARVSNRSHALGAVSTSFRAMMQVIMFGTGAALVLMHEAGAGVIIAGSIIMGRALAPIDQAINAWRQTSGAVSAFRRLDRLLKTAVSEEAVRVEDLDGRLEVADAGLRINDKQILEGVNFRLEKGEIMGLVGPNGAGKTCLCRMILGMWAPSAGNVRLSDRDIHRLDQDRLGSYLGYLPQDVELFPGTVSQNIARLGPVDSSAVVEAARLAGAHEVILRFPLGYETDIGEAGESLSGGQRQRVGLARALYGSPGLVVLDEPNSNLDEAGEKALGRALQKLKQKQVTTIMITHKPELLSQVDKIMVLKQGRMVAFGSREEIFRTFFQPGAAGSSGGQGRAGGGETGETGGKGFS